MKNKLKLFTVLKINHATTMMKVFVDNLSDQDILFLGEHSMLTQIKTSDVK